MAKLGYVKENWTMSNEGSSFNDSVVQCYFIRDVQVFCFFLFSRMCAVLEGFHNATFPRQKHRAMAKVVRIKRENK